MEKLLIIDAGNYDPTLPEICRTAIRGIIFSEKKILLVRSAAGDIKFPGGGQEMLDQKGLSLPSQRDFAVLKLLAERAALPHK
ncbi:MAG: hypothetical protein HFE45_08220 [Oscillospiraceae bacterium]|jgi:hypothetical protein|nr:hypothetical protein [Oscillospiraceae bacterium]